MVVMRYLCFFVVSVGAFAQPFGVGLKVGVPLTDALNAASSGNVSYVANNHHYVIGPSAELRLPFGFSVEVDALYRNFDYHLTSQTTVANLTSSTSSGAWEFPFLAKYRLFSGPIRPYGLGGLSFNRLSGISQTFSCLGTGCTSSSGKTSDPAELDHRSSVGIVFGAGLEVKALVIRLSPEIRYTRWGTANFSSVNGLLKSGQNQAEFLVGISF